MSKSPLKIAIAGLGTVGGGTVQLLHDQADLLASRAGRKLTLVGAAALVKPSDLPLDGVPFFTDARVMAKDCDYDVLVELIGGAGGIALDVVKTALERGRSVVTANKAMIAHHGVELARIAEAKGGNMGFEASVGGGIPIIKSLREGLSGNAVGKVMGILNGTCNYILTTMRDSGRDFADVLAEAQALGYAEADPTFDIDGIDTAHKLAILVSLAFAMPIDLEAIACEGIRHVSALDIRYADELGYRIKLLGVASRSEAGVEARVYPAMVPLSFPLAHVSGPFNAIVTEGDFVGRTVLEGRGAGARPTASAVVADLMDLARGRVMPTFGVPVDSLMPLPAASSGAHHSAYYIRLMVKDEPGVFADVAAALRDEKVSMEQIIQRGRAPAETVPVVMTVHETDEASMLRAVARIKALGSVADLQLIRIENL
ncbi:homoserine dehydrogenase [Paramagnetospirillum kuznetsovii]|uniref:Homoserine dehydrogenase n=1 Tax=Paramagnetospirillum kuznetsovii TaxID=2053833 RepID=A0A364NT08_9PROT|nr:homoserine dehydrogenase [Paramagnetospirillum kuznetsovii]RAU20150.1 homoserine dehydrogenase [Paramagnetospirillum kuznetsovii]